jgi:hypothetical protein
MAVTSRAAFVLTNGVDHALTADTSTGLVVDQSAAT